MKVGIDLGKCCGHARCYAIDREIFQLDDSGYALHADVEIPPGDRRKRGWPCPVPRAGHQPEVTSGAESVAG